ncbi:MAG: hypothetical protein ACRDWG_18730 [Actinomycetes bacterium]
MSRHEAQHLHGETIHWDNHPLSTTRVRWSKRDRDGDLVTGSLRTICHLNRLNNLAIKKFDTEIVIIQPPYNTGVEASKGTHDFDCCVDLHIPEVNWWTQQRFFRANGLGCWYRFPPTFGHHIHGITLPKPEGTSHLDDFATKVGWYVPTQLKDYYNHAFGLKDQHERNSDDSWFPSDIDATVFDLGAYIRTRQLLGL